MIMANPERHSITARGGSSIFHCRAIAPHTDCFQAAPERPHADSEPASCHLNPTQININHAVGLPICPASTPIRLMSIVTLGIWIHLLPLALIF